ncbi:MAG: diguanylate cyclase, partial [Thiogranum sp.]
GDEFAVLLHRTHPDDARGVAFNLCHTIDGQFSAGSYSELPAPLTASFGLSALPTQARDEVELFELADKALYEAKSNGRNQVVRHTSCLDVVEKGRLRQLTLVSSRSAEKSKN